MVECFKFGHPVQSSEFLNYALNTKFVAAVGMLRKKTFVSWNSFKTKQFYKNYISPEKIKIWTRQVYVRTLDGVSELWTVCPNLRHTIQVKCIMFALFYFLFYLSTVDIATVVQASPVGVLSRTLTPEDLGTLTSKYYF